MENKIKNFHNNIIKIYIGVIINIILIIINLVLIFFSIDKIRIKEMNSIIILILIWNALCIIIIWYLLNKKIPSIKERYVLLNSIEDTFNNKKRTKDKLIDKDLLIKNSIDLMKLINIILIVCGILFMILVIGVIAW